MYTMEFYSAIKKDNIMSFTGKWIELENIMLSEISQSQKIRNQPGVVVHACNPSIWEAETGGSWFEDSLSYLVRLCNLVRPGFK